MAKGVKAPAPYEGFTVYKVIHSKNLRAYACLVSDDGRTSISWAKYVYETTTGVKVPAGMAVDHIDEDKTNDSFSNLQLLSTADNNRKHAALTRPARSVEKKCPHCGKIFQIAERMCRFWGTRRPFHCSRSCATTAWKRRSKV